MARRYALRDDQWDHIRAVAFHLTSGQASDMKGADAGCRFYRSAPCLLAEPMTAAAIMRGSNT
ncbi:hypothetical protein [Xanthomonas sp. GPE 39]|uniref:hypothetical protein n=1 Tax=Xanthomonas sp. GPE 39 TaxID=1583099 RepID=UPI0005F2F93A|nr:hypothetical protein [Xanthomonas sp. GPE 39]